MQPPTVLSEQLAHKQVHVWTVHLSPARGLTAQQLLESEERARASRFRAADDRIRYVQARAALRVLAGAYLAAPPSSFVFAENIHGKPEIAGEALRFNVSHSGMLASYAFAWALDVGIDLEQVLDLPDYLAVAARAFTPAECEHLAHLAPHRLQAAFYETWTRTEAALKAAGVGFAAERISAERAPGLVLRVQPFEPAPGYRGAVAWIGDGSEQVVYRHLRCDRMFDTTTDFTLGHLGH